MSRGSTEQARLAEILRSRPSKERLAQKIVGLEAALVQAEERNAKLERVAAAAEKVANQNSESASPALQRALSGLDFALDALAVSPEKNQ